MATKRRTVTNLVVKITEDNQRVISATVQFSAGNDDYVLAIPNLIQTRVNELVREFLKNISEGDDIIRDLVKDTDYTIRLQPNGP